MTKKFGLSMALVASFGLVACGDDGGDGTNPDPDEPALVGAFPNASFLGRTTTVSLFGVDTSWSDASTIDFGAGVTVNSVTAVGETGLIADITIGTDAALGARDLTVNDGTGSVTLTGGFTVGESVSVGTVSGDLAQGAFVQVEITNNDTDNPFDTTPGIFGGFDNFFPQPVSPEVGAFVVDLTETSATLVLTLDVNAPARVTLDLQNGPATSFQSNFANFDVATRAATVITLGNYAGSVGGPFQSALLEIPTGAGPGWLDLAFANTAAPGADVFIQLLGPSGAFADAIGFADIDNPTVSRFSEAGPIYAIVWDTTGAAAYDFTVDTVAEAAVETAQAEPNNDSGAAQAVTNPGFVSGGTFLDALDEDWFTIDVTANDVGQAIEVVTFGPDGGDTIIEVLQPDGQTQVAISSDAGFFDSLTTPATTVSGLHFVRIFHSDFEVPDPANSAYSATIRFVAPLAP